MKYIIIAIIALTQINVYAQDTVQDTIVLTIEDLRSVKVYLSDKVKFDSVETELYLIDSTNIVIPKELKKRLNKNKGGRDKLKNKKKKIDGILKKLGISKSEFKTLIKEYSNN